jgi:enoyl reductase-like protein
MDITKTELIQADMRVTRVLAGLLERMERSNEPFDAGQYRSVVKRLADVLANAKSGEALAALLDAHPGASQVYENINYQYAGLCRSALDPALDAENEVRQLIDRVKREAS